MALDINLDAAKEVFFTEARQLLGEVETYVLQLEQNPTDREILNAAFRAAHTIKGSAGIFGFTAVTHFVHDLETMLDRVRNGELSFDETMSTLVLECRDHTSALIDWLDGGEIADEPPAELKVIQTGLTDRLRAYLVGGTASKANAATAAHVASPVVDSTEKSWHISARFTESTFRDGFDPRPIFSYLESFGEIRTLVPVLDRLPAFNMADAESCYLGYELQFVTDKSEADIAEAFDFVAEQSKIIILPHDCTAEQWTHLVEQLPEGIERAQVLMQETGFPQPPHGVSDESEPTTTQLMASSQSTSAAIDKANQSSKKSSKAAAKNSSPTANSFIRVPADKLDALINLVGELVIANAGTVEKAKHSNDTAMLESTVSVASLIEEIRDGALGLRMVQIGETFQRFQRVVRDLSMSLGKQIKLEISGEDTELDKSVVERIGDPLMHLVRNAIDHGLEITADRELAGKSPVGRIGLNAYHDSGHIVIEVSDDGRGLARDKIFKKAVERGLIAADANLSDAEVNQLIFLPGFSTADQVTDISGRGVGMDVVKRNIEALRGTVQVRSTPGKGATFEIRLPLTLAIIDGFLISVGGSFYVIPLGFVRECLELDNDGADCDRMDSHFDLRGEFLPYVRLRSVFDFHGARPKRENVIVVRFGNVTAGIVADQLHGESQTVIKPLGALFEGHKAVSGGTILGNGDVALIIDVPKLIGEVTARSSASYEQ